VGGGGRGRIWLAMASALLHAVQNCFNMQNVNFYMCVAASISMVA